MLHATELGAFRVNKRLNFSNKWR